jgi:hypothetical protein
VVGAAKEDAGAKHGKEVQEDGRHVVASAHLQPSETTAATPTADEETSGVEHKNMLYASEIQYMLR